MILMMMVITMVVAVAVGDVADVGRVGAGTGAGADRVVSEEADRLMRCISGSPGLLLSRRCCLRLKSVAIDSSYNHLTRMRFEPQFCVVLQICL